ncbi:MAG: PA14 domain-containing protein [Sulfolobales archaeon]
MIMKYLFIRMQSGLVHGLLGFYYIIEDINMLKTSREPLMTRVDPYINFVWFEPVFRDTSSMDFMVEWYGYLNIFKEGYYVLLMECDDGCIMELENELVIDGWREQPPTLYQTSPLYLSRRSYEIRIRYYNVGPFGLIKLGWVTPNGVIEGIPPENLYTRRGNSVVVRGLPAGSVIEVWTNKILDKAVVGDDGLAFLRTNTAYPIDGYFKIIKEDEEFQSPVIRDIWGGDVFEIKEVS